MANKLLLEPASRAHYKNLICIHASYTYFNFSKKKLLNAVSQKPIRWEFSQAVDSPDATENLIWRTNLLLAFAGRAT